MCLRDSHFAAADPKNAHTLTTLLTDATHRLRDPADAFREFHRVARDRTLHHLTAEEQFRSHWALHYFPLQRYEEPGEHPSRAALVTMLSTAGFCDVEAIRFDYEDTRVSRRNNPQRIRFWLPTGSELPG